MVDQIVNQNDDEDVLATNLARRNLGVKHPLQICGRTFFFTCQTLDGALECLLISITTFTTRQDWGPLENKRNLDPHDKENT